MTPTPKILIITNSYPSPYKVYAAKYVERHVHLHREAGLQVTVLAPGDSRRGLWHNLRKYGRLSWLSLKALLCGDFDLVHAHWELPAGLLGMVLSKVRGKPFVLTSHGAFTDSYAQRPWLIRRFVRMVLRAADHIIPVGEAQEPKVRAIADLPASRLTVINMGVWLQEAPVSQLEARQILDLPLEQNIIVFIGNLLRCKGPDILIDSIKYLRDYDIDVKVIIGGGGVERDNLLAQIEQLDLGGMITFIGVVSPEDVFTWFAAADVCVVPSRTESFGLVAIEAMACGTPVVAANVGGLCETITHGENGFLFPVDDAFALAEQLRLLLTDEVLRRSVIEAGQRTAAAQDMRLKAAQVKGIYEMLLI